jgi:hypothetical protein
MLGSRRIQLPLNIVSRKLPVWQLVGESYAFTANNFPQLIRIAWLPILMMLPVFVLATWLVSPWQPQAGQLSKDLTSQFVTALPGLVQLPFLASIAVAWHRLVLRQETVPGWLYARFDATVWRYAGFGLLLNLLAYLPTIVYGGESSGQKLLASLTTLAFVLFLLPRIALSLPAIALQRELDPWESWRATNRNTLRLGFAGILSLWPLLVPIGLAVMHLERTWDIPKLITTPIASVVGTLATMVSITLLSMAFDFFIRRGDTRR